MSNDDNRVLNRRGARKLTQNEIEQIAGAAITRASITLTGPASHPDTGMDT